MQPRYGGPQARHRSSAPDWDSGRPVVEVDDPANGIYWSPPDENGSQAAVVEGMVKALWSQLHERGTTPRQS
jgi:hypothetical protein